MPKKPAKTRTKTDHSDGILTRKRKPTRKGVAKKPPRTQRVPEASENKVQTLLNVCRPVPQDWIEDMATLDLDTKTLPPLPCNNYEELIGYWKKATRWRQDMDDVLVFMLSVVASTCQLGDQIFGMVVGNASGGKSKFCDGLTISPHCYALESLTGFLSGYQDSEGNDYSLLARTNRHCMITSEGDVLMSSPNAVQIMAQCRRMFDGKFTASYKNLKEDRQYDALRLSWIIAGTPAMLDKDQASLGDRFLKVYLDNPDYDEKRKILKRVSSNAWESLQVRMEEKDLSTSDPIQTEAQQRLAGYVDWLWDNTHLLKDITCEQKYFDQCENLALFAAIARSRPPKTDDITPGVEEPHRLNHQFVRLMGCAALVTNRTSIDESLMRRIRKYAFDTSKGPMLDIIELLYRENDYMATKSIAISLHKKDEPIRRCLLFLRQVGVVRLATDDKRNAPKSRKPLWCLEEDMVSLCEEVLDNV